MGRVASLSRPALVLWLPLGLAGLAAPLASAQGQGLVVRDGTLGSGPLEVGAGTDSLGRPATYLITPELGKQSHGNLFHSFRFFGIGNGETATFTGPDPIDGPQSVSHVISRVTGGEPSQIDGTLRSTIPGASVWLFNPSGVGFGAGAEIDVPGSFHASTADSVAFEDGGEPFRARAEPEPLLATAKPSAFGFLPDGSRAALVVAGGLRVTRGEALLARGDVTFTGAGLEAPGADLGFEATGEVRFADETQVDVGGAAPGTISIRGGRIEVVGGSQLLAENEYAAPRRGPRPRGPEPGSITVEARESVRVVDHSLLSVSTHGAGNAGTLRISGFAGGPHPDVLFEHGEGLHDWNPVEADSGARAETTSSGAAGRISIEARSLVLRDGVAVSAGAVGAKPTPVARGAAGAVEIRADSVEVADRSFIAVGGWGSTGKAGTIEIDLGGSGALVADGHSPPTADPHRYALILAGNGGSPGSIEIRGGSIWVRNGGSITASADDGVGPGGRIDIVDAPSVVIETGGQIRAGTTTAGDAGSIWISAGDISLATGGNIFAGTSGAGDAGHVEIDAEGLRLETGGVIGAATYGAGGGGRITIDADRITLTGTQGDQASLIDASTLGSLAHAGTIDIRTRTLEVERGGLIIAESRDPTRSAQPGGDAGTIAIVADEVSVGGLGEQTSRNPNGQSMINATSNTSGRAGTIEMTTRTLVVDRGGIILAVNVGRGGGGAIDLHASESIWVDGGGIPPATLYEILTLAAAVPAGIFTTEFPIRPSPEAPSGSIHLEAPEITITDGGFVSTATIGGGAAGALLLEGERIRILAGASVTSSSTLSPVTTLPGGDAGSVTLLASELIEVAGRHPDPRFDDVSRVISAAASDGDAGAVTLQAPRIVIDEGAVFTTAVESAAPPGRVAQASDITLDGGQVIVRNGGRIDASSFVPGEAGRIEVSASESIVVEGIGMDGTRSGIASRTGGDGPGGNVALRAPRIEIARGGEVSAESAPGREVVERTFTGILRRLVRLPTDDPMQVTGNAGSIALAASEIVQLDGGDITTSVGVAQGGKITIDPVFVILQHGGSITSEALLDGGRGGEIQIATDNFLQFPGSRVSAQGRTPELSGTVEIHSPDVNLAGTLAELPSSFLDAASLMRERCAARRSGERVGSFAVRGPGGIPAEPDGWLPAPHLPAPEPASLAAPIPRPLLVASLGIPFPAHGACP